MHLLSRNLKTLYSKLCGNIFGRSSRPFIYSLSASREREFFSVLVVDRVKSWQQSTHIIPGILYKQCPAETSNRLIFQQSSAMSSNEGNPGSADGTGLVFKLLSVQFFVYFVCVWQSCSFACNCVGRL